MKHLFHKKENRALCNAPAVDFVVSFNLKECDCEECKQIWVRAHEAVGRASGIRYNAMKLLGLDSFYELDQAT